MRVTVADAAGANGDGGRISVGDARCPLGRKRFALWLVGIASILTLGHLLGPQSDLLAIAPHGHESEQDHHEAPSHDHGAEQDHPDAPSHGHGAHACGLAVLPDAEPEAPVGETADPIAVDCAHPVAPVADTVDTRDRSPTDPVSELQVNRV